MWDGGEKKIPILDKNMNTCVFKFVARVLSFLDKVVFYKKIYMEVVPNIRKIYFSSL